MTVGAIVLAARDDWETPPDLFVQYDESYRFALDPCANAKNALCADYIDRESDGLAAKWAMRDGYRDTRVWLHPPHSEPALWARKAVVESHRGALVVGLFPARTGEGWWHEFVLAYAYDVRYLRGTPAFRLSGLPLIDAGRPIPQGGFAVVRWGDHGQPLTRRISARLRRTLDAIGPNA